MSRWTLTEIDLRLKKIVLEAEKNGITMEISKKKELILRDLNISTNYVNPPIPEGYEHVCGEWNNGFVIERLSDGSQFVWIPVGSLDSDGTIDGKNFSLKFGRRDFKNDFPYYGPYERLNDGLLEQIGSVIKYGGFYISRYNISVNLEGKPQSIKGAWPLTGISHDDAEKIASTIENKEAIKSHLTFGAEYDSILKWFITTKVKTFDEIAIDSAEWGNFSDELLKTGSKEKWCANNIYDFAGNVEEWTQERIIGDDEYISFACRGGSCCYFYKFPASERLYSPHPTSYTGFRAALYIK